jgi:hypothetical protein
MDFPNAFSNSNAFSNWHETHFEIVSAIVTYAAEYDVVKAAQKKHGHGGLYELAKDLTNEFETLHSETLWDGEYREQLEKFIDEKLR